MTRGSMERAARVVYALFGALTLGLGALTLVRPELALHPDVYSPLTAHLVREQGAEGVFMGLMAFWCLFHFDQRRPVHFALIVFAALFAAIHWAEFFAARRPLASPLINSVPLVAFLATAPYARPKKSPG